jgi:hypothetical protein
MSNAVEVVEGATEAQRPTHDTAGIRSFEPLVPPMKLLLPPFAASTNR